MKLLVISHTEHYRKNGGVVGWGATVRELDQLSTLFDQLVHLAPLHSGPAPESAIAYESSRVAFRPVPAAGGPHWRAKPGILATLPAYARAIRRELKEADAVHVRCPANISMLALLMLSVRRDPKVRWAKYAGNWRPPGREAISYSFQRWLLNQGYHRGVTTVNGRWDGQPSHVHTFLNPCLTEEELAEAKKRPRETALAQPVRLILVGRLDTGKGVRRALTILAGLKAKGIAAVLDLIGDGPERAHFEQMARNLGIAAQTHFHGWLPRPCLGEHYARAHFILLPTSSSEGWPKVLSEAMAYGAVPVCSDISSIPQNLREFGVGRTFAPDDVDGYCKAIAEYLATPVMWQRESELCQVAAERFSYANYLNSVRALLHLEAAPVLVAHEAWQH